MNIIVNADDLNLEGILKDLKKNLVNISARKLNVFLKKNSPKDKGKMSDSWENHESENSVTISNDVPYVPYVNDGTGVFGKNGKPITPRSPNGVMVFTKGGQTIFTKRVQGQKGQKFIEKSINDLENILPQILAEGFK